MRLFTDFLRDYRKGIVAKAAGEVLESVARSVVATGKPGKMTLEITVNPEKGGGNQLTIASKVTAKLPYDDLPEAVFFADADGVLHRQDPDQREMFEEVDPVTGEVTSKPVARGPVAVA